MHRVMATRDVPPPPTQRTAGVAASVVGDTAKLTAANWTPWINFSSLRYPGGGNGHRAIAPAFAICAGRGGRPYRAPHLIGGDRATLRASQNEQLGLLKWSTV